jgi:hypothetical protein
MKRLRRLGQTDAAGGRQPGQRCLPLRQWGGSLNAAEQPTRTRLPISGVANRGP